MPECYVKSISYEIQDISVTGEEATVSVKLGTVSATAEQQYLVPAMLEVMRKFQQEVYPQYASFEELNAATKDPSSAESQKMMKKFMEGGWFDKLLDSYLSAYEKAAATPSSIEYKIKTLKLKKTDGKWLIQ